jgi:hypothetical protein
MLKRAEGRPAYRREPNVRLERAALRRGLGSIGPVIPTRVARPPTGRAHRGASELRRERRAALQPSTCPQYS